VSGDDHEAGGGVQDASLLAAAAAGDSSRRPRKGKGAAAVLQGPQVVFRAAGGVRMQRFVLVLWVREVAQLMCWWRST
jgi:hypothetical protein